MKGIGLILTVALLALHPGAARAEIVSEAPADSRPAVAEARAAYKNREYARVVELSTAILKSDPGCAAATELLSRAHEKLDAAQQRIVDANAGHADAQALTNVERSSIPPPELAAVPRPWLPTRAELAEPEQYKAADKILRQPVTADFQNADLDWVLTILNETSGINIVADPAAIKEKKVTLHVANMPLEDVLDFIVRNNDGIQYSVKKGSLWITATSDDKALKKLMFSRIYPLNYGLLPMKANGGMNATIAAGGGANGAGNTGRNSSPFSPFPPPAPKPAAPADSGSAAGEGEGSYIEKVLAWAKDKQDPDIFPSGADYLIDRQSNQLIVFTTPAGHARILDILDHFDRPPVQILIQTRFLDVSDEVERSLGANLQSLNTPTTSASTGATAGTPLNPSQQFTLNGAGLGTPGFLPGTLGPGSAFTFIGSRTNPQFQIQLTALLNDVKTKVLSQPQIIAINNKESSINIGTKFEYIESLTPNLSVVPVNLVNNQSQFNGYTPQFGEQEVGFKLFVTPSVGRDLKTINLHLRPEINSLAQGQQISDFQNVNLNTQSNSSSLSFPKPTIDDSTFETDVAVEDNGYVMIGGLLQNFDEKRDRKVPGLSKIPYLGALFKSTSRDVRRRNLMIIVEAHIISAGGRRYISDPSCEPGGGK